MENNEVSHNKETQEDLAEKRAQHFELLSGVTLAFFAAVLAITDLGGGKYGDDEIIGTNEKSSMYQWYQSKSVKQSLVEGQRDMLQSLIDSKAIEKKYSASITIHIKKLNEEIDRYKKEKKELMLGSAAVGKDNWMQEVDGEKGKIVGAKEWEKKVEILGKAGDVFDLSVLWLQLCLVIGAISLVLKNPRLKWVFYGLMVGGGGIGIFFSVRAFLIAFSAG